MGATVSRPSEQKTFAYAELWSPDPFIVLINQNWWPSAHPLASENKGDERNIGSGARYKVDFPGPCWVVWQGTGQGGYRTLQTQQAASVEALGNAPGAAFLPVYPGINLIEFGDEPEEPGGPEPEPPEPEPPEPEPPAELPKPQTITIFTGGGGQQTTPIVHWRQLGEKGTSSEFWELIMVVPRDHYDKLWKGLEQELMEALHDR